MIAESALLGFLVVLKLLSNSTITNCESPVLFQKISFTAVVSLIATYLSDSKLVTPNLKLAGFICS